MLTILIIFVVVLMLAAVCWYAVDQLAPEPIARFLRVAIVIVAAIVIAYMLLGLSPETLRFR